MGIYTPGPWSLECALSSDMYNIRYITGPNGEKIACINHRIKMSQDEALANARLIAAAPDLLDALKILINHQPPLHKNPLVDNQRRNDIARTAVEKAEGKHHG